MQNKEAKSLIAILVVVGLVSVGTYASQLVPANQQQGGSPVVTVPGTVAAPSSSDVPTQKAVAVKQVESPAAPSHYQEQALWALVVSFLIQFLKKSPWFGWISPESSRRLKTQFGFLCAFLTAAGIHFAVSGSLMDGGGASVTVSGLSINAFKDVVWQWASQQAWYRAVVIEDATVVQAQVVKPVVKEGVV